nr:MAG TPA: hypothetical protein [Crassvirales sp.]
MGGRGKCLPSHFSKNCIYMSTQTISIPWASGETDSIHLTWNDSGIPGDVIVTITSDKNTTGIIRQKDIIFTTQALSGPQASASLRIIQDVEGLVIAKYNDIISMYNEIKAGFKVES